MEGRGDPRPSPSARPATVSPGAVENATSLLTYDSKVLVENFLLQPKHDPSFLPLFPEDTTSGSSQPTEVAELCGDNNFCNFDVAATGSLSMGNASRVAHMQHLFRVQSLQPGEGGRGLGRWGDGGGGHLALGLSLLGWWQQPAASISGLWSMSRLHPSGVLRLAGPTLLRAQGGRELPGGLHHPLPL